MLFWGGSFYEFELSEIEGFIFAISKINCIVVVFKRGIFIIIANV